MVRSSVLNLNNLTQHKQDNINTLITEYQSFMQKVVNALWNRNIFEGRYVGKHLYIEIKSDLTERYKQCAAKQAFQIVKSQREKEIKTKPTVHNVSLELDSRFTSIENSKASKIYDMWLKLSILNGKPIYIPSKKHYHFNRLVENGWIQKRSCRVRKSKKGLFLDVLFEKNILENKPDGEIVGLDCGYRKLAVLSNGQMVGTQLKAQITTFYKRKKSHKIIADYIHHELKKIDFTTIKILVVEDLLNVKKNKKRKFTCHTNRLLSNWAYRLTLNKLEMLCNENRVQIAYRHPAYTSQVCNHCKVRDKTSRKDERYECHHCGRKVDADYNASMNIRDFWLVQGQYGVLSETYFGVPNG